MKCPSKRLHFPIIMLAIGKDKVFLLVSNLRFLLSKLGPLAKIKNDLHEKRIFHYKLSKKLSEAHRNISIFKIVLYDTNS